jgi:hypothetical protein
MARKIFLPAVLLTSLVSSFAHASQDCAPLGAPHGPGFAPAQAAAAVMGPLVAVKRPMRHVPFPEGPLESVRISLSRGPCYGSCPYYSIELKGDGSGHYTGHSDVLVVGHHASDVSPTSIQCLLTHFKQADFWSLPDGYNADVTDISMYTVTLTIGGQTKTISDYGDSAEGTPAPVKTLEEEIDRIGANRWVVGDSETLPNLQKEGFDFHSQTAAVILANSAATAPEDLVMGLIEAGAPVTGEASGLRRGAVSTAVARASGVGRVAVVQALIARGAFSNGPPDVKEATLRSAAGSGNPLMVAEILKYKLDVNAQDIEGDTALIRLWRSQHFGADKSKTDVVGIARLLLDAGADPNVTNKSGSTALFSASNAEVVRLLIKAGAKNDIRNQYGDTPLLWAESDDAAVALIEAGADTTVKAKSDDSIEQRAIKKNFKNTIRLLRQQKH